MDVRNIIAEKVQKILLENIATIVFNSCIKDLNTNGISIDDLTLLDTYGLNSVDNSK